MFPTEKREYATMTTLKYHFKYITIIQLANIGIHDDTNCYWLNHGSWDGLSSSWTVSLRPTVAIWLLGRGKTEMTDESKTRTTGHQILEYGSKDLTQTPHLTGQRIGHKVKMDE